MKFAIVDGLKREAQPKLRGHCPHCNGEVRAQCGDIKIWHWAHTSIRDCDHWWEPETTWHREWKNEFPAHWQEVRHSAPDGEVHRADVKTEKGRVLEFQNSAISLSERVSRENFYKPMNWVVNGTNWKRDLPSFQKALVDALYIPGEHVKLLMLVQACPLLQRWVGSRCLAYIDFGDEKFRLVRRINEPILWRLEFIKQGTHVIATPVSRQSFIQHHRDNGRLRGYRMPPQRTQGSPLSISSVTPQAPLYAFERYLRQQEAKRRRFMDRI
jgi:competence protein CoiA